MADDMAYIDSWRCLRTILGRSTYGVVGRNDA